MCSWSMCFFNHQLKNAQWQTLGGQDQLLLNSGLTYKNKDAKIRFTLGFSNITCGQFGELDKRFKENRIYQEALLPQKLGNRIIIT